MFIRLHIPILQSNRVQRGCVASGSDTVFQTRLQLSLRCDLVITERILVKVTVQCLPHWCEMKLSPSKPVLFPCLESVHGHICNLAFIAAQERTDILKPLYLEHTFLNSNLTFT